MLERLNLKSQSLQYFRTQSLNRTRERYISHATKSN